MSNEIELIYDFESEKFIVASKTEKIALTLIAAHREELFLGAEIIVSTTVTNTEEMGVKKDSIVSKILGQKIYTWLRMKSCSIVNKFIGKSKMDKVIKSEMAKGNMVSMCWTIEKGLHGRYSDLDTHKIDKDCSWRIIMHNTPIEIVQAIASELCKTFKQQTVLIHDFKSNRVMLWDKN